MKREIQTDYGILTIGTRVICNGYPGTVIEIHSGQLKGMIDVRLDRGTITVDARDYRTVKKEVPSEL